jgi:ketosteroid isomerase-like protein
VGVEENKETVRRYFERMAAGDPSATDLLADDVRWWVPQGSSMAGTYEGKPSVLELMGRGVDLYASDPPMRTTLEQLVAEGDWVCVQLVIDAKTATGLDYHNHYHFAFRLRGGSIVEVKEYVDTKYVHDVLGI